MNPRQAIPIIGAAGASGPAAPAVLAIIAIGLTLCWLFSGDDEKKPDEPADEEKGNSARPAPAPMRPVFTPASISPQAPKPAPVSAPVPASKPQVLPVAPAPIAQRTRREVMRADLATIFNNGTRALTRKAAVDALKVLGFGKTAAYKALSMDGRFARCLQFAPDGLISWKG